MAQQNYRRLANFPQRRRDDLPRKTQDTPRLAAVPLAGKPVKAPLISRSVVQGIAAFGESLVIIGLGIALMFFYVQPDDGFTIVTYGAVLVIGTLAILLLFRIRRLYTIEALLQPAWAIGGLSATFMAMFAALAG